jgi:ferredoxin-NADP reductase/Na+-translocating ferredoxin:NAD+ oxidoreductase RnfD subunit
VSVGLGPIDRLLNGVTMYRLVLWWLVILVGAAAVFSTLGILPFNAGYILASAVFLLAVSLLANELFARAFGAAPNTESVYITALILALIISPTDTFSNLGLLAWAAILSTACKYVLAFRRRHLFNPAAFAVVLTSFALGQSATWWVGSAALLPLVVAGGFLVVRKTREWDMIGAFFITVLVTLLAASTLQGAALLSVTREMVLASPLFFFAFAMLTEPLTAPSTHPLRLWYGALVGFLFVPLVHFGPLSFTPELALICGNLFAYVVGPKTNLLLTLRGRQKLGAGSYEFVFEGDRALSFRPGQYLEWTLPHDDPDSRGIRRYLTIASSPADRLVRVGVRFSPESSTFKKRLLGMKRDDKLFAGHLAGNFVLPHDPKEKLVFVAGGIGVTPFASMIRDLLSRRESRPITVLFGNLTDSDIAYKELLEQADKKLGIRTVHVLSDVGSLPVDGTGRTGFIDERVIREEVPDYKERTFYISGPPLMVKSCRKALNRLGVRGSRIRTDYFPGLA